MLPRLRHPLPVTNPVDFNVYYTAALLVRQGQATGLYQGADTGANPQKAIAAPGTPLREAADSLRLPFVGLYVYPPLLADLLVPLTWFPLATATHVWLGLNLVFLLATVLLLARTLGMAIPSLPFAVLLVSVLCFTPALQCLVDGQVTILLLLLWAGGLVLYKEDHPIGSGVLFALATAIKLTPALVLLPFLLWRSWRVLAGYISSLVVCGGLCLWIDGPHTALVYFSRVMPAMSGAMPYMTNLSYASATARLLTVLQTGSIARYPDAVGQSAMWVGKAASMAVFLLVVLVLLRARARMTTNKRVLVLGLLSLMAPVLSPVSWFHAYATSVIAFVLLWWDALKNEAGTAYLSWLVVVTVLLGSAVSENLAPWLMSSGQHSLLLGILQFGQLTAASALVLYSMWAREQPTPLLLTGKA